MYKRCIVLSLLIFLLISETYAGDPHGIWGRCSEGYDGTSCVGAVVSACLERTNETITTKVGNNEAYLLDASDFEQWKIGDTVRLEIRKVDCYAKAPVFELSSAGSQKVDKLALTCPEPPYRPDPTEPDDNDTDDPPRPPTENISVNDTGEKNKSIDVPVKVENKTGDNETKKENKSVNPPDIQAKSVENHTTSNVSEFNKSKENDITDDGSGNVIWILGLFIACAILVLFLFYVFRKDKQKQEGKISNIDGTDRITETGDSIAAKTIPKLTDDEVKVLKEIIFKDMSEEELSGKIGPTVSYTLEKLKNYNIIHIDDSGKVHVHDWAKPKFIYEYKLDPEQKNIVMLLRKEGELTQTKISKKTKIAPATLTRRMENLEVMKIVERRVDGSRKNVKLTCWFRDNL